MVETTIEMARRHVREGEARVARQIALVDELRADGHERAVATAEGLLIQLKVALASQREHLRLLEAEKG